MTGRQRRPINTGDCLIEVTAWAGLNICSMLHCCTISMDTKYVM